MTIKSGTRYLKEQKWSSVDYGIKDFATASEGDIFGNINNEQKKIKKLGKRFR